MKNLFVAAVDLYQLVGRAVLPRSCRFTPSCSDFAKTAVAAHGWAGAAMACRRLLRCHPLHPGGWDPVPERGPQAAA